jgi:hypothetical protein
MNTETGPFPAVVIDQEFRDLIPPLSSDERARLQVSLQEEGCRDPLVAWGRVLIDGHHRYAICQEHRIPYRVVPMEFESRNAAMWWVFNNQLSRRNLTDYQRTEMALKMKPVFEAMNKERQRAAGGAEPGKTKVGQNGQQNTPKTPEKTQKALVQNSAQALKTRDAIATAAGVSHDTVRKVEHIVEKATPSLADAAREGKVSISAAAAVADLPKPEQRQIVAAGPEAVKAKAKELREEKAPSPKTEARPAPADEVDRLMSEIATIVAKPGPQVSYLHLRKKFAALQEAYANVRVNKKPAKAKWKFREDCPPRVRQAFEESAIVDDTLNLLDRAKANVNRMVPSEKPREDGQAPEKMLCASQMKRNIIVDGIDTARDHIAAYRPHVACGYCAGTGLNSSGKKCTCGGFGWLPKAVGSVPSEKLAAVEGMVRKL